MCGLAKKWRLCLIHFRLLQTLFLVRKVTKCKKKPYYIFKEYAEHVVGIANSSSEEGQNNVHLAAKLIILLEGALPLCVACSNATTSRSVQNMELLFLKQDLCPTF